MKIFIGLTEMAGYFTNLQKGLRQCGVEALFVPLQEHPFAYEEEALPWIPKWVQWCCRRHQSSRKNSPLKWKLLIPLIGVARCLLFIWALFKYDVFIFGFGTSFLKLKDLPILKFFNKTVICTFHGSDTRPPYLDGYEMSDQSMTIAKCMESAKKKKKKILEIERSATAIIASLTHSHFHQKKFISWMEVGIPCDLQNQIVVSKRDAPKDSVRILHAPSSLMGKGTYEFRKVIQSLKNRGFLIEWVEISGKPHAIVKEELVKCDFIVDQLYSDTPMAGFATEAAFFGKPAVVGGYYHDYSNDIIPPSLYCHPDDIEKAIEKMIVDVAFREDLGKKAKDYVNAHWTSKGVAEKFLRIIRGDIPERWMCNPYDIHYVQGACMPEVKVKELVLQIIKEGGLKALQLTDKPSLEKELMDFASS